MRSIAYVFLLVHWPTWATIASAISAAAVAIWAFWEQIMSRAKATIEFLRSLRSYREEGRTIKEQRREQAIRDMLGKLKTMEFELQQTPGYSNTRLTEVVPSPGEDPQIVAEAWQRFKLERDERDNKSWKQ